MIRITFAAACAAMALAAAGAASAHVSVAYGDLDLATSDGAMALNARIDRAAHRTCRFARATGSHLSDSAFCENQFRQAVLEGLSDRHRADYARGSASITF